MKGFFLEIDEFNTLILANLISWKLKKKHPGLQLATICHREYEVLFNNFDKRIYYPQISEIESPVDYLAGNIKGREQLRAIAENELKSHNIEIITHEKLEYLIQETIDIQSIHKTVLVNSIHHLLSIGPMIKASVEDLKNVDCYLSSISMRKTYYLIIGRYRRTHPEYNNLLKFQIFMNLLLGREVINATTPKPDLYFGKYFSKYHEIPKQLSGYGFTVGLMERAKETTLIGNAGGVGVHMMTSSNLKIVGLMNWVNGKDFADKGITLFKARKLAGLVTKHTWVGESPRNLLRGLKGMIHGMTGGG